MLEASSQRLAGYLATRLGADSVEIGAAQLLSGGTLQENWRLDLTCVGGAYDGALDVVLRASCANAIPGSLSRAEEFEVLQTVYKAGVTVAEPLLCCDDRTVVGTDFLLTRTLAGTASPGLVTRSAEWGGDKEALARRVGEELGRMQTVTPRSSGLAFLPEPRRPAAETMLETLRAGLPGSHAPSPMLEWGLRWLEANLPQSADMVLTHGDFRTANVMVDRNGLTGILDWELASWGDPYADIGWFCARFWRFGQDEKEAGGLGSRRSFYDGYAGVTGAPPCPRRALYWEIMACARWAVISIQQLHRHLSGETPSLELALTGKCTIEAEYELVRLIQAARKGGFGDAE